MSIRPINEINLRQGATVDLRTLEAFYWVARRRSFRRAAEELDLTQPVISQRVARLEDQLKVELLLRDQRPVALTDGGRLAFDFAERLLALCGEMKAKVMAPASLTGTLRVGVAETIAHTWLSRFHERMDEACPGIELQIDVDISVRLHDRLLRRDDQSIDLAFMVGPVGTPEIGTRPLNTERLAFLASPRLGLGRRTRIEDIAAQKIITFARNTQPFRDLAALLSARGLAPPRIYASAPVVAVAQMAEDRMGVALLPVSIVDEQIAARRLVEVRCDVRVPDLQFVAAWRTTPDMGIIGPAVQIAAEVAGEHARRAAGAAHTPRRTPRASGGRIKPRRRPDDQPGRRRR